MRYDGQQFKRYRMGKGWSLRSLAKRAGVSTATVQRLEKGSHRTHPASAAKVADALGKPLEAMVTEAAS